jgi:hypothetical protein
MKRFIVLSILISGSLLLSCEKDNNTGNKNNFQFETTVISQGINCGETFIIALKSSNNDSDIENGRYYANNFDSDFKVPELKIYLNCREPNNDDEFFACTMIGSTYPHVIVTNCKKVEE